MNRLINTFRLPLALLVILPFALASTGCRSSNVEVIDLNKVLGIYDQVVKSKEDAEKTEGSKLEVPQSEFEADTKEFLTTFASELNKAKLIKSTIGVEMLQTGMIRGFKDVDKNGVRSTSTSKEPEIFTIELDTKSNRIIATQKVATQTYRRDHHYGSHYHRYYFFHRMHGSMWYRQNRYYSSPGRVRPNYSSFSMSSPT